MTTLVSIPESTQKIQGQPATWEDYLAYINNPNLEDFNISFNQGYLWIDMGNEGINHARFNELLTLVFGFWFARQPDLLVDLLGGCVIEKPNNFNAAFWFSQQIRNQVSSRNLVSVGFC